MQRSKFPGKPSKLVTKKRVSVLNGNNINNNSGGVPSTLSSSTSSSSLLAASNLFGIQGNTNNNNESNNDIDPDDPLANNDNTEQSSINDSQLNSDIALRSSNVTNSAKCDVAQVKYIHNKKKKKQYSIFSQLNRKTKRKNKKVVENFSFNSFALRIGMRECECEDSVGENSDFQFRFFFFGLFRIYILRD